MKKSIINKFFLLAFTMLAITIIGFVATTTVFVKADGATDLNLETINYTLEDGAYIRMLLDEENKPVIDEKSNGIKFIAKIDSIEYKALSGKGVKFGILVMPYDYIEGKTLTENLFFGENREFYFSDSESFEGGKKIVNVVTDALAEGEDYHYYSASIVDLKSENKDREFAAIPYVMNENEYGVQTYKLKEFNTVNNVRSMSYIAQLANESNNTAVYTEEVKGALIANYVTGKTNTIDVKYEISYGGKTVEFSEKVTVDLDAKLDADALVELLRDKVDANLYDYSTATLKQNGETVEQIKVYANGNTKEDATLTFNAKEQSSDTVKGYYVADGLDLVIKSDAAIINGAQRYTYKFFKDGTIIANDGVNDVIGSFDSKNSVITMNVDGSDIAFSNELYLSESIVKNYTGCYKDEGGALLELKANGEMIYDKGGFVNNEENASYAIYYDATAESFKIMVSSNSVASIKDFDLTANSINVGDRTFTKAEFADATAYEEFANTYVSMRKTSGGADLIESRLTFTTDGNVFYLDPDVGSNSLTFNESMGKYILLANNEIQLKVKQGYTDVIVTGTYTVDGNKNTLNVTLGGKEYAYESVHVTEDDVYAALAGESGTQYNAFGSNGDRNNYGGSFTLYNEVAKKNNSNTTGWKRLVLTQSSYLYISHASTSKYECAYTIKQVNNYMGYFEYYWTERNNEHFEGCYLLIDGKYHIYMANNARMSLSVGGLGIYTGDSTSNYKSRYIISDIARLMNASDVVVEENGAEDNVVSADPVTMTEIAGKYSRTADNKGNNYDSGWNPSFTFDADGNVTYSSDSSNPGTYSLEPDADNPNFGKIKFNLKWDKNLEGYYVRVNGEIVLRLRSGHLQVSKNHWLDYKKSGTNFSTWDVFANLAGNGNGEDGTMKQYVSADNETTLSLYNDGAFARLTLTHLNANPRYHGAEGKLVINGSTYCGRYDLLPTGATSGKIYFDVYGSEPNEVDSSVSDKDFWATYELVGKNYVITFTFDGVDCLLSLAGSISVEDMIAGTYFGNKTLVLKSNGDATYGADTNATYVTQYITATTGIITIWATSEDVYGYYEIMNSGVRIVLVENGVKCVYLKQQSSANDIYAQFVGTYMSGEWTRMNSSGKYATILGGVSIKLNADKTFTVEEIVAADATAKLFTSAKGGKYEIKLVDGVYCIALYFDTNAFVQYSTDTSADWRETTVTTYNERYFVGCFDADGNIVMNFRSTKTSSQDLIARTYVKQVEQA